MTTEQLTYYDPQGLTTLEHIITTIDTAIDSMSIPSLSAISLGLFAYTPMTTTFSTLPPPSMLIEIMDLCSITSSTILTISQPQLKPQP